MGAGYSNGSVVSAYGWIDVMITTENKIKLILNFFQDSIPKIARDILLNMDKHPPGIGGDAVRLIVENLDLLTEGKFIILSGPIGCGKSIASYIGALLWTWNREIEPAYCSLLEKLETNDEYTLEDFDLYEISEGPNHERALSYIFKFWKNPRPNFKILRASDILKDAVRMDSRTVAKFRGLLVIDDLGREYFTDKGFGIAEWDAFFDIRYCDMLPTIATTNMTPEEFVQKYNRRIYDRLKECAEWLTITGGSLR